MSATTTDGTTVTLSTEKGSSGPIPLDEFNDRMDDAVDRIRSRQLSFDTGDRGEPDFATVKISGSLGVARDIPKRQHVTVTVIDHDGEVLATGLGVVTNLAFPDKTDSHGITTTERVHTITLG